MFYGHRVITIKYSWPIGERGKGIPLKKRTKTTKLDSEINAPFPLNECGDPHFLFYKFKENNMRNNWEKIWRKSMATSLANKINVTDRDVMGPTKQG